MPTHIEFAILFLPVIGLGAYLILCILAGLMGRRRGKGFWTAFVIALILSPIVVIAVLLVWGSRSAPN